MRTKYESFLKGDLVDLVIINQEVLEKHSWHSWLNDQKITKYTKQGYYPLSKEEHLKYVKENIFAKKRIQLGILDNKRKVLIGMISLYNINHLDRCCSVSALFNKNDKKIDSIKFFLEAQNLIVKHAFDKLNLRRIEAASNDERMLKMNQKLFGFKCEGVLKQRDFIEGEYKDRYLLAILKE